MYCIVIFSRLLGILKMKYFKESCTFSTLHNLQHNFRTSRSSKYCQTAGLERGKHVRHFPQQQAYT